jgi:hypothetical protein
MYLTNLWDVEFVHSVFPVLREVPGDRKKM